VGFPYAEGTPIVAAREGMVRMARGDSTEGGCDEKFAAKANYVVVSHGDGLETQYSTSARCGEARRAREARPAPGFSGATAGRAVRTSFKVAQETGRGWNNPSVPARIVGYGDPMRDMRVAAPVCRDAQDSMVAAHEPARTGEAVVSLSAAGGGSAGVERPPARAKAVLDGFSEPPAQGGEGLRKARPARPVSNPASARETR